MKAIAHGHDLGADKSRDRGGGTRDPGNGPPDLPHGLLNGCEVSTGGIVAGEDRLMKNAGVTLGEVVCRLAEHAVHVFVHRIGGDVKAAGVGSVDGDRREIGVGFGCDNSGVHAILPQGHGFQSEAGARKTCSPRRQEITLKKLVSQAGVKINQYTAGA